MNILKEYLSVQITFIFDINGSEHIGVATKVKNNEEKSGVFKKETSGKYLKELKKMSSEEVKSRSTSKEACISAMDITLQQIADIFSCLSLDGCHVQTKE